MDETGVFKEDKQIPNETVEEIKRKWLRAFLFPLCYPPS
jgi:hypothetical protein